MATIVTLPQIGISEESAVLAKWNVKVGDKVKPGDVLFSLETGKAAFDVESEAGGVVLAIFVQEGEEKPIKAPVCAIGTEGEKVEAPEGVASPAIPAEQEAKPAEAPTPAEAASIQRQPDGGARGVSPRARALSEKAGLDPTLASPTGPEGRVIERDIRALIDSGVIAIGRGELTGSGQSKPAAAEAEYTDIPHTTIRKVIASNMQASLQTLAQLTHHHSFDASALLSLRKRCKESGDEVVRGITLGDMVLYAVARTLLSHPDLNAHYSDTHLRRFAHVGLGVAVDTPRGLIVPTLPDADAKSVRELSLLCKAAARDAQAGKVDTSVTATFTVSNLGNLGVEMFTPVINPPQAGILGVCGITHRVRADGSAYPAMGLSLTYDHRAIDGAPASRFMRDLCGRLENFDLMLL